MIESKNNERVKYFRKLREKKYIFEEKEFIVEGEHLVEEAIKNNSALELIILEGKDYNTNLKKTYVSFEVMKSISLLESIPYIMAVVKKLDEKEIGERIVILDGVSDPGNVGTIIRNSVAFNIDTIVFTNGSASLYNDKVIRSAQGMIFHINIITMSLEETINTIKNKNIKIYATCLDGKDFDNMEINKKYAIIFGNEGAGISNYSKENADELVKIEMNSKCESLNVGVSSGIVLYKFR